VVEVALKEQATVAKEFLDGLVSEMGLPAQVTISHVDEEIVELAIEGDDLGVLIGQKGSTLYALQDLTRTVVQRHTGATNGRLLVDVAGYRHKRQEALSRFARQVASQVQTEGKPKVLEPMNAADRKVVHDTINAIDGVSTTSEGEEPRRHVVVLPAP
jgi:spoIIIJ-associated protein